VVFFKEILAVGFAGSFGAVARLLIGRGVQRLAGEGVRFPLGTLVVNVSGCLLLGWFLAAAHRKGIMSDVLRNAIAVGFIGSYTTFSTWAHDTDGLWRGGHRAAAVANLIASVVVGLIAVRVGSLLGARG
jgi:CrcB protein